MYGIRHHMSSPDAHQAFQSMHSFRTCIWNSCLLYTKPSSIKHIKLHNVSDYQTNWLYRTPNPSSLARISILTASLNSLSIVLSLTLTISLIHSRPIIEIRWTEIRHNERTPFVTSVKIRVTHHPLPGTLKLQQEQRNSHRITGVNAAGDAGDTSPPIFWLGGTSIGISPPTLLRTFGCSRPILVVLAQWQHLMMSFIHWFARKSKICDATESTQTPLRELTIQKNFS